MAEHCSIIFPLIGLIRFRQQFRMTNEYVLHVWSCAGAGSWHLELFDTCRIMLSDDAFNTRTHCCCILTLISFPFSIRFLDQHLVCGVIIMTIMPLITQMPLKMNMFSNHNLLHDFTFVLRSRSSQMSAYLHKDYKNKPLRSITDTSIISMTICLLTSTFVRSHQRYQLSSWFNLCVLMYTRFM